MSQLQSFPRTQSLFVIVITVFLWKNSSDSSRGFSYSSSWCRFSVLFVIQCSSMRVYSSNFLYNRQLFLQGLYNETWERLSNKTFSIVCLSEREILKWETSREKPISFPFLLRCMRINTRWVWRSRLGSLTPNSTESQSSEKFDEETKGTLKCTFQVSIQWKRGHTQTERGYTLYWRSRWRWRRSLSKESYEKEMRSSLLIQSNTVSSEEIKTSEPKETRRANSCFL